MNKLYVTILGIVAFFMTVIYVNIFTLDLDNNFAHLIFWILLAIVSETFLIALPSKAGTSVGMAIYIAAIMLYNPLFAIIVVICAMIFRLPEIQGKRVHILNLSPWISTFNISSHVIFIGIISILYDVLATKVTQSYQKMVIVMLLISFGEIISIILISLYYYTRDKRHEIPFFRTLMGALPSTWAVGALGLIIAFVGESYQDEIILLIFIPLLLARYSFKLYFDSQKSSQETIEALNEALFVRDAYTAGHTTRVEEYAILLAKATNYTAKDLETLTRAAKLHDIGKIGVPDGILNKPGKLTQEEYFQIRDHAAMGHKILSNVDSLKKVAEVVRHHHERPDGKGYPDGLKDNEIPRDSAILAIADTFDAMTSDRPYRKALSKEQALAELEKYKGTQFNQFLAEVFISIMKEYDSSKPQEVVAITEVAKHEHVDEKKVASTTLSKAVARHKKETVRLAEEVAE